MNPPLTLWNIGSSTVAAGAPVERASVGIEDGRIVAIGTADGDAAGPTDWRAHLMRDSSTPTRTSRAARNRVRFGPPPAQHGGIRTPRLGYFVLASTPRAAAQSDSPRRRQL
jgi:hypothetical protein